MYQNSHDKNFEASTCIRIVSNKHNKNFEASKCDNNFEALNALGVSQKEFESF